MSDALTSHSAQTRTIARSAVETFAARVISMLLGIATGILIARALGPVGKGLFGAPALFLTVPLAMTGGVGQAMVFFMTKQQRGVRELLAALALTLAGMTAVLWAAAAVYASLRGWSVVLVAFALVVPPSIVLSWQPGYYIATGSLIRFNVQTVAYSGVALALIALALFGLHAGTPGALGAWILATYAAAGVVAWDAARKSGGLDFCDLRKRLRALAKLGSQCGISDVLAVLNYRIDSFVIVFLLGLAQFGIYSVAVGIGEALFMLTRPLSTAISREIGSADMERATLLTARTVRIAVLLTTSAGVVSFTIAPMLLTALYGARFAPAAEALRWLIPGIVAYSSAEAFIPIFLYQLGRPGIAAAVNGGMIVLQAALSLVLVPQFGISGAAMASSAAYVLGAAAITAYFCRVTGISASSVWVVRAADIRGFLTLASHALLRWFVATP